MMLTTRAYSTLLRRWWRLWPRRALIVINEQLWQEMVAELGRRGLDGRREAGAFLLAARAKDQRRVARAVYLDDLDPDCLVGGVHFRAAGYSKLWDFCDAEGLRVLADVHTHPSTWVAQSSVDRENPMIARVGHLALIVPAYGTRPVAAREVGVNEYLGERGWTSWFGSEAERVLQIRSNG